MARIRTEVELDEAVLRQAQTAADSSGRSGDDVIEKALRRQLARGALDDVLHRARAANDLSADEALELAYSEGDAERAERRQARPQVHDDAAG